MAEIRHPAINRMTADDYRARIKFMTDQITDMTDLRQLHTIAHRKFITRAGTRVPEPVSEKQYYINKITADLPKMTEEDLENTLYYVSGKLPR